MTRPYQEMSQTRKGTLRESQGNTWLLGRGNEVFPNICRAGFVDTVAINPTATHIRLIDTKTYRPSCGVKAENYLTQFQISRRVACLIVFPDGEVRFAGAAYDPDIPTPIPTPPCLRTYRNHEQPCFEARVSYGCCG